MLDEGQDMVLLAADFFEYLLQRGIGGLPFQQRIQPVVQGPAAGQPTRSPSHAPPAGPRRLGRSAAASGRMSERSGSGETRQ